LWDTAVTAFSIIASVLSIIPAAEHIRNPSLFSNNTHRITKFEEEIKNTDLSSKSVAVSKNIIATAASSIKADKKTSAVSAIVSSKTSLEIKIDRNVRSGRN
jgi:hypothetical protein